MHNKLFYPAMLILFAALAYTLYEVGLIAGGVVAILLGVVVWIGPANRSEDLMGETAGAFSASIGILLIILEILKKSGF